MEYLLSIMLSAHAEPMSLVFWVRAHLFKSDRCNSSFPQHSSRFVKALYYYFAVKRTRPFVEGSRNSADQQFYRLTWFLRNMAGEPDEDKGIGESMATAAAEKETAKVSKKKNTGLISRIWRALFGSRNDDFERRLERISKEEVYVLSRMRRRSQSWRRMKRFLIMISVLLEFVAVSIAIMTARSVEDWKKRVFRVLPMFVLPGLSSVTYSALVSFMNLCDRKDQKTLEKLRAERQSKIDELKEKTNYYIIQQLIQRYDTDPAAKAAAATVLASKLGADSGLKVDVGDDPNLNTAAGKSNDVELVQSSGLRNRKQPQATSRSTGIPVLHNSDETVSQNLRAQSADLNWPVFVDHYQGQGSAAYGGGWMARIAALLVGEDPTQCYALICGNCHMHNGLASKEDFPVITYICPHCRAVNGPRQQHTRGSGSNVPINISSSMTADNGSANAPNSKGNEISTVDNKEAHYGSKEAALPVAAVRSEKMAVSGDRVS
ncbi:hypothetical protein Nepgr_010092 [Nepenthes gracilis]|uniref:Lunapark zinc ribbon domain-containing protein n=1 Tax=Nepenthes gracilis TaxID=150966 RepID=A0AAD3SCR1_NEPGR|nr:hypothetical protein Nepgr_010092 [Nepenthes gracilis]